MAGEDHFKRYLEIGASVLGMTRERAESIVRDLVASGEVAKGQATKAADWLVERSRAGSEELAELVRREIRQQMNAVGLATKDDVARLEGQIAELRAAVGAGPPPSAAARSRARPAKAAKGATKAAGITRSASAGKRPRNPPAAGVDPPKG